MASSSSSHPAHSARSPPMSAGSSPPNRSTMSPSLPIVQPTPVGSSSGGSLILHQLVPQSQLGQGREGTAEDEADRGRQADKQRAGLLPMTPAPSPGPTERAIALYPAHGAPTSDVLLANFSQLPPSARHDFLTSLLGLITTSELLLLSQAITPRLKRDFLQDLPLEIALHVLSFVDSPRTLARASCVSRFWRRLLEDEWTWKEMCQRHRFGSLAPRVTGGSIGGSEIGMSEGEAQSEIEGQRSSSARASDGPGVPRITPSTIMTYGTPHRFANTHPDVASPAGWQPSRANNPYASHPSASGSYLYPSAAPPLPQHNYPFAPIYTEETDPLDPYETSTSEDDDLSDEDTGNDELMTDLTISRPTAPSSNAPAGFLSTVPFSFSSAFTSTNRKAARKKVPSRGLSLASGEDRMVLERASSQPVISNASMDHEQEEGRASEGKGKGREKKRRASGTEHLFDKDDESENDRERFSYRMHFKKAYLTESNWLRGGRLLSTHTSTDDGVVTSLAVDDNHIVIGMANCKIHVFEAESGTFIRTLVGHELGVWCLTLVSAGGERVEVPAPGQKGSDDDEESRGMDGVETGGGFGRYGAFGHGGPIDSRRSSDGANAWEGGPMRTVDATSVDSTTSTNSFSQFHQGGPASSTTSLPTTFNNISDVPGMRGFLGSRPKRAARFGEKSDQSDVCGAARGWGQPHAMIVSGGCDRDVRVWDIETGECLHVLEGHTSTIRCIKVLQGRPIAVSGSRDASIRVWDLESGRLLHLLAGHDQSVRCIEVSGNKVVSGSYDCTCRLWDVDTGECLHVFRGHYHQIYAIAFDGDRLATGSLDSTVRVWSARTGECLALLTGHTSLVGQLQLTNSILVTGGSDGRVIIFDLSTFECLYRLCAHDNSVTCLQFDDRFIVSGGNDGRVKLWDLRSGAFVRELTKPCEAVWRVTFKDDKCVVLLKRAGKTVMEVLTFRPADEEL